MKTFTNTTKLLLINKTKTENLVVTLKTLKLSSRLNSVNIGNKTEYVPLKIHVHLLTVERKLDTKLTSLKIIKPKNVKNSLKTDSAHMVSDANFNMFSLTVLTILNHNPKIA